MTIQQRLRQLAEKQGLADMGFFPDRPSGKRGAGLWYYFGSPLIRCCGG